MKNVNTDEDFYLEFEKTKISIKNIDIYSLISQNFSQISSSSEVKINNITFFLILQKLNSQIVIIFLLLRKNI